MGGREGAGSTGGVVGMMMMRLCRVGSFDLRLIQLQDNAGANFENTAEHHGLRNSVSSKMDSTFR